MRHFIEPKPVRATLAVAVALTLALTCTLLVAETPTPPLPPPIKNQVEKVMCTVDGRQKQLEGRVLIEAADGGILLQTDDGVLWPLQPGSIQHRVSTDRPFVPVKSAVLADRLAALLPPGFRTYTTPHYILCYNTSREYAQWTSSLLERLHKAFTSYWQGKGLTLREPEFPLVVMVFADRASYDAASREDLPGGTSGIVGFYSLKTNRINMFDLTGTEAMRSGDGHRGSMREINAMLSRPEAVPQVATIVHEATHQIAFNSGLQTRFADIPLWLCEGMAVYFEAPDLASTRGWRGIGKVNYPRLATFRENLGQWNNDTLENLIADNRRFRDPKTAVDAYADAWALNYYLIRFKPDEYAAYLKMLAEKRPMMEDDRETHLKEFKHYFGELRSLTQDFLKRMSTVK